MYNAKDRKTLGVASLRLSSHLYLWSLSQSTCLDPPATSPPRSLFSQECSEGERDSSAAPIPGPETALLEEKEVEACNASKEETVAVVNGSNGKEAKDVV